MLGALARRLLPAALPPAARRRALAAAAGAGTGGAPSSAAKVRALRERTGAGMLDVKRALEAADWDEEVAADALRAKGLAKVRRAGAAGRGCGRGCGRAGGRGEAHAAGCGLLRREHTDARRCALPRCACRLCDRRGSPAERGHAGRGTVHAAVSGRRSVETCQRVRSAPTRGACSPDLGGGWRPCEGLSSFAPERACRPDDSVERHRGAQHPSPARSLPLRFCALGRVRR